jgi:hypothetical protein
VVTQKRQLFLLTQSPNGATGDPRTANILIAHFKLLSVALEEASNP